MNVETSRDRSWPLILLGLVLLLGGGAEAPAEELADVPLSRLRTEVAAADVPALEERADAYQAALTDALDEAEALEDEVSAATEEKKAELEADLTARRATVTALVRRYALVVEALDERGGDVALHQQALFEATKDARYLGAGAAVSLLGKWATEGREWLVRDAPRLAIKLVVCLVVLIVFWILGSMAGKVSRQALSRSRLRASELLKNFTQNIVAKGVFFLGLLIALSTLGVPIGPFLAGIGVVGFVVGFALQDTLNNFAAGVMLLLYRPYDVGDFVSAGGVTGTVEAMTLVSTTMLTPDNQVNVVPNGKIWGGVITNVTANATRRVDLVVGIGYQDDVDEAERVMLEVVQAHEKVLSDPPPMVRAFKLNESSVDVAVRPWVRSADYWDVLCDLTKRLKKRLDAEGISIPFPQRDLHLVSNEAGLGAPRRDDPNDRDRVERA